MSIDTANWGASPARVQCYNCNQFGHKASKCPTTRNQNNNNSRNQNGQGKRGNQKGNQTNNPQQWWQARAPLHCRNCPAKTNHTTEDCRKKMRPQNSNGFNNTAPGFGFNTTQTAVTAAAQNQPQNAPAPQVSSIPYCPGCNSTDHTELQCTDDDALRRLRRSPFVCAKCGLRGHTKDDCRNPLKTKCGNCHLSGHCTGECRVDNLDFGQIFLSNANRASERFKWKVPQYCGWVLGPGQQARLDLARMQEEAQRKGQSLPFDTVRQAQAIIKQQEASLAKWGAPTVDSDCQMQDDSAAPLPSSAAANTKDNSQLSDQDRELRIHVERPHLMYHRHNANSEFRKYEVQIRERNILLDPVLFQANSLIATGSQFWRDPRALEAIARRQKPRCRCCGKDGLFLDKNMRGISPSVEVLTVEDYKERGVFILFHCQCCNQGFDYVPRAA